MIIDLGMKLTVKVMDDLTETLVLSYLEYDLLHRIYQTGSTSSESRSSLKQPTEYNTDQRENYQL